tara:strand:- start:953 stop:2392 length:1440 start_codon:yes stop_codon:yes gene_type:complete
MRWDKLLEGVASGAQTGFDMRQRHNQGKRAEALQADNFKTSDLNRQHAVTQEGRAVAKEADRVLNAPLRRQALETANTNAIDSNNRANVAGARTTEQHETGLREKAADNKAGSSTLMADYIMQAEQPAFEAVPRENGETDEAYIARNDQAQVAHDAKGTELTEAKAQIYGASQQGARDYLSQAQKANAIINDKNVSLAVKTQVAAALKETQRLGTDNALEKHEASMDIFNDPKSTPEQKTAAIASAEDAITVASLYDGDMNTSMKAKWVPEVPAVEGGDTGTGPLLSRPAVPGHFQVGIFDIREAGSENGGVVSTMELTKERAQKFIQEKRAEVAGKSAIDVRSEQTALQDKATNAKLDIDEKVVNIQETAAKAEKAAAEAVEILNKKIGNLTVGQTQTEQKALMGMLPDQTLESEKYQAFVNMIPDILPSVTNAGDHTVALKTLQELYDNGAVKSKPVGKEIIFFDINDSELYRLPTE